MNKYICFLLVILSISACKSGKKALDKGQYDKAVYLSVKRLKNAPTNKKAQLSLKSAYPIAQKYHKDRIDSYQRSADVYKWEKIGREYQSLNALHSSIMACPACMNVIRNPRKYVTELDNAQLRAAEVRYELGMEALQRSTREDAKEAYYHFLQAKAFRPRFKDVNEKIEEAKFHATLKVVVSKIPMHSVAMQISNDFFQNKIREFLNNFPASEFVRFYTYQEAEKEGLKTPDQIVDLRFDDFFVGNVYEKEKVKTYTRDSVVISTITLESGVKQDVYGTVEAELSTFTRAIDSRGVLNFLILDGSSQRVLSNEKFPGSFTWVTEWASFNGDKRALTTEQLKLCNNKPAMSPPPQQLFIEFTKPIYDQLTNRMAAFYGRY